MNLDLSSSCEIPAVRSRPGRYGKKSSRTNKLVLKHNCCLLLWNMWLELTCLHSESLHNTHCQDSHFLGLVAEAYRRPIEFHDRMTLGHLNDNVHASPSKRSKNLAKTLMSVSISHGQEHCLKTRKVERRLTTRKRVCANAIWCRRKTRVAETNTLEYTTYNEMCATCILEWKLVLPKLALTPKRNLTASLRWFLDRSPHWPKHVKYI